MNLSWGAIVASFERVVPEGSPRRKLLIIVAIILVFEGISVLILFSKAGLAAGAFSLALGVLLLLLLYPEPEREPSRPSKEAKPAEVPDTPGIKLMDAIMKRLGSDYVLMCIGAIIIAIVFLWNLFVSANPDIGDLDTLSILLGAMMIAYPFLADKFKVEAVFSLLFLGLVALFLVVPQAVMSTGSTAGTSVGNWYVHYMLAAPFAGILDLIGIPSTSYGNMVTIQFQDGSLHSLGISAYCAGLYSFSIFLAAFFAFVLVFERIRTRTLMIVLAVGLLVAFLGNLFRMVVIGIVGYYQGLDALLWAHENVGWIIFLSWSVVFWYLLLGYVSKHSLNRTGATEAH